jgi:integrase
MAQLLPSGNWREVIRRKGLGLHTATFPTKQAALRWKAAKLSQLYKAKGVVVVGQTLAITMAEYFNSARHLQKAPGTRSREKCCEAPVLYINGNGMAKRPRAWTNNPIDIIDGLDVQSYIDARSQEKSLRNSAQSISPDSIRLEVRLLSAVFKHAVQCRYREGNPALARQSGYVLPRSNIRDTRITPSQESSLSLSASNHVALSRRTNPSLHPWLEFVRATGCRPGEAAKVELDWVHLDKGYVDVPRRGTKKRHPRRVLLNGALVEILRHQLQRARNARSPYLFFSHSRKNASETIPYQYNTAWRHIRELAGVKAEAHGMRREYISRLFEQSALTDGQIALMVGDVNPMSLEPYKHLRATELRAQYDAFQALQDEGRKREAAKSVVEGLQTLGIDLGAFPPALQDLLQGKVDPEMEEYTDPVSYRTGDLSPQTVEIIRSHKELMRSARRKSK